MSQTLNKTPWTAEQVDALDPVVQRVVRAFLAWSEREILATGNLPDFEACESYVFGDDPPQIDPDLAAEIVTREATATRSLLQWVEDDGLGGWSELREAAPDLYDAGAMFQSVVASWLHDIIGCPERRG